MMLWLAAAPLWAADCGRTSLGLTPLHDPFFFRYGGFEGGLYPGGANRRPADYEALGLQAAAQVNPRNAAGAVDPTAGKVVLISIGMSNTTQEFSVFKSLADRDPDKNPRLVIVDTAVGGASADRTVANPAPYWQEVSRRLDAAGVTPAQVQAAWVKQADAGPTLAFPADARKLQSEIETIVASMPARFPNLRLVYFSSRIYAGYASTTLNPEPFAYQSGFAVKWLIERRILHDPGDGMWASWGPYLWADGSTMRGDGLTWNCADLQEDGTHPSPAGQQKVARMLLDFFQTDVTARSWFVRAAAPPVPEPIAAAIVNSAGYAEELAFYSIASIFGAHLADSEETAKALPLPATLGGTRVEIGGVPAPLYYASPGQINLVLPKAGADMTVVVIRGDTVSNPLTPKMQLWAPGFYTLNGVPGGSVAALHANWSVVTPANPARRGEIIQIFGTGLGVRNPMLMIPDFLPVVRIGGLPAEVKFSGWAPGYPGMNQFNMAVPLDAPVGDAVSITIQLGSAVSNQASVAIRQ